MNPTQDGRDTRERRVVGRVMRRLLPYLFLCYTVNYLDRVNVSFAALEMTGDLGFTPAVFGLGAGMFFIGYVLFEVPSNLIMGVVGARRWIARIMVTWGVLTSALAFVHTPAGFYGVRLLLGIAEAGFFPGIIFYLAHWIPARERARASALFLTSTALSGVIGGPLSGFIMKLRGAHGLAGWQWLFLLEGLPAIVLGLVTLRFLDDRIADARWLAPADRAWLERRLGAEHAAVRERRLHVAVPALAGAVGLALAALCRDRFPLGGFLALCLAAAGIWSTLGPFWSLPTVFLSGTAAAGGIALINSMGNAGGFVGPYAVGYVRDLTGSYAGGLWFLCATLVAGSALSFTIRTDRRAG